MFSDTFVTILFSGMTIVGLLGVIWISGINKETARIQKEIADMKLSQKRPA